MPETLPRFAVFGHPVAHSLSPHIQTAFAAQFGLQVSYERIDVDPADFTRVVRAFFADGGDGANVTVPHKRAAWELASERSEAAERAGVANVLHKAADGGLIADNTDGSGLLRDLMQRQGITIAGASVLLLGAGGAARGVLSHFLEAGVATVTIANRSPTKAEVLATAAGDRVHAMAWQALGSLSAQPLIINATSAGLHGQALDLPVSLVDVNTRCCDLSYGPAAAPFLDFARGAGASQVFDGLGMLVETAADSFELWFGKRPETEPVLQMLRSEA